MTDYLCSSKTKAFKSCMICRPYCRIQRHRHANLYFSPWVWTLSCLISWLNYTNRGHGRNVYVKAYRKRHTAS
jgi:hypothetical protein